MNAHTTVSSWQSHLESGVQDDFASYLPNNAMRSRLAPVKKVVKMLRRHEEGLLSYSHHRISNACAEGFNSAIQLIKANARGFRTSPTPEQEFCFTVETSIWQSAKKKSQ